MFFERGKLGLNQRWRYLVGCILIFCGWQIIASIPIVTLYLYIRLKGGSQDLNIFRAAASVGWDNNSTLLVLLSSFVLVCCSVFFVVKYIHRRPFLSILTGRPSFSWERAFFGFFCWMLLSLLLFFVSYQKSPEEYRFSFELYNFLPLLLICLFLLPFQTSFEEFFFRGYIMQGLGIVSGSRLIALLVPAVLFGVLHGVNPEVLRHGFFVMMPFYIGMGIFLGVIGIMDEGIEIPLGIHFANNLTAALFVNIEDSAMPTDALFTVVNYHPEQEIAVSIAAMLFFVLLAASVFHWKDWGKLVRKIKH